MAESDRTVGPSVKWLRRSYDDADLPEDIGLGEYRMSLCHGAATGPGLAALAPLEKFLFQGTGTSLGAIRASS